ncbi:MAG TPA: di-heme oxidoredictase family protein [Pyrinomonadaceae bacterium]|nr:di-heme oxidoredictase family protein [Pyrinomonadaceae bacterium]
MRVFRIMTLVLMLAVLLILPATNRTVHSVAQQEADQANVAATTDATYTTGSVDLEGVPENDTTTYTFSTTSDPPAAGATQTSTSSETSMATAQTDLSCVQPPISQAPANGFDDVTNGLIPQGATPDPCASPAPTPGTFLVDKSVFDDVDEIDDGLGPVYNAQSCRECHQNPVTGAISQITELRAGHTVNNTFFDAPGGSLINNRGIPTLNYSDKHMSAKVQERVPPLFTAGIIPPPGGGPAITGEEGTRTFRTSLNTLGDGFVEAIADGTLVSIAARQKGQTNQEVHGLVINVPVLEAGGKKRVGRFGWKNQHASLLSFSGDAYLNEIGITNFLILNENSSLGRSVAAFDSVPDNTFCDHDPTVVCGEDTEQDIKVFAEFMRATQAPPRDPDIIQQYPDVAAGAALFESMNGQYSCSVCHVPSIVTANHCQPINAGAFNVPDALARKIIHPFGDFLLHDIGTGDFIVQNGGPVTRTTVRTAPLWGVRTRTNLMHDGESLTFNEAILRHSGEALQVRLRYQALTATQKRQLITFIESL